jgi:hypothetical protein
VEQPFTTFSAILRSEDPPRPAGNDLAERSQEPESAAVYPVATTGPSVVDLVVRDGAPVVAAVRTSGEGNDVGATAGSTEATKAWVVTPTAAGEPALPGLLLLNPGQSEAAVSVSSIPGDGAAQQERSLSVPPGSVAVVASGFLADAGTASMMVESRSPIVALGASTSLGNAGLSVFGLAVGVPIPTAGDP